MSVWEPASSGGGASSTSSTFSSVQQPWLTDAIESERTDKRACVAAATRIEYERTAAMRQQIRGMEAQLMDLVSQSPSAGALMDWLRVPLRCAVIAGNFAIVKRLLAAGVETATPPKRLQPLLHLAAKRGDERIVEELLKVGVDVNEPDSTRYRRTALHCAATAGSSAAVRTLISAGAFIDEFDAGRQTPLHLACTYGHRDVVVFLLLNGARAQQRFGDKHPPLHLAAIHNHPGVIEDLLYFGNVSIERYDMEGQSALHVAAQYRRVEACVALLRGGAAAVTPAGTSEMTCLDVAASRGHAGQLLQVLTTAEPTDVREGLCSMALHYAVSANKPDTIRDLVALGADVEYIKAGTVPNLHAAALRDQYKAAKALLQAGADVEARFGGSTPLHLACSYAKSRAVQLLLHWGANEYATDSDGNCPSGVVGIDAPHINMELFPEDFANKQTVENCIWRMLARAPADRRWRRRGWLVVCRGRWLARIGERENRCSAQLEYAPDGATGAKKRRGIAPAPALVVKPRYFSLDKGKARGRNEGGGRRLTEAAAAAVLRLGTSSVLSDGGAGQAAGAAGQGGRMPFVAVVEKLLLLREDSIFREIVTFL